MREGAKENDVRKNRRFPFLLCHNLNALSLVAFYKRERERKMSLSPSFGKENDLRKMTLSFLANILPALVPFYSRERGGGILTMDK